MSDTIRPARVLGCKCSEASDDTVLAVLTLTPADAGEILLRRAELLARKVLGTGVVSVEYDAMNVRFFHEIISACAATADFFAAVAGLAESLPAVDEERWFDLGDIAIPEEGDYRTAYDLLRIAEHGIVIEACGKHASVSFETPDLPLDLIREVAGPTEIVRVTARPATKDALDLLEELLSLTGPYKELMDHGDVRAWSRISAEAADLRQPDDDDDDDDDDGYDLGNAMRDARAIAETDVVQSPDKAGEDENAYRN